MKIKEISFDEPITEQINEVDAIILLKNYNESQAYAYYELTIPKSIRSFITPTDQQRQEFGAINAIKNNIIGYAYKNTNPENVWNTFLNENIRNEENVREYCNRLMSLVKMSRPNMSMEDTMFFLKPKLFELVGNQVKPLIMCQAQEDISKLVDMIQMIRTTEAHEIQASTNAIRLRNKPKMACFRCGNEYHLARNCKCSSICDRCKKRGHVTRLCKSKLFKTSNNVIEDREFNSYFVCLSRNIKTLKDLKNNNFNYQLKINIFNQNFVALADTGSGCSLLSRKVVPNETTKPSNIKLMAANGSKIDVIGEITTIVTLGGKSKLHKFLVVNELIYDCIIGRDLLTAFGFVLEMEKIKSVLCTIENSKNAMERFKEDFQSIFDEQNQLKSVDLPKMEISTSVDTVFVPPRQQPFALRQEIQRQTTEMLRNDIIRESESPNNSPIVMVKKKNNGYRFCVDFRKLNSVTQREQYPMPYLSDASSRMVGSTVFSTIDLKHGYWQLELEETSKHKTAFSTHEGHFEFNRIPFGLVNAPGFFQRTISKLFSQHVGVFCYIYLDDIIVFSRDFDEHIIHLRKIFSILNQHNLRINFDKCSFFAKRVSYLGHVITKEGIGTDPEKTRCISQYPVPQNLKELRSFLGLANYYREHIKEFSLMASPLYQLCKKNTKYIWEKEHQEAFELLKFKLVNPPLLSFPDMNKAFTVTTDASNVGIGAVLSQDKSNKHVVIQYASKSLDAQQMKYSAYEKEAYAIVFAVKTFRKYLIGTKFTIITDHNPLKYLMNARDGHGRIARWLLFLQEYDFEIKHKKGVLNKDADCLSRIPTKELCSVDSSQDLLDEIINFQKQDETAKRIVESILKCKSTYKGKYILEENIVFRKLELGNQQLRQLFVPIKYRKQVLDEAHKISGHSGHFKTFCHIRNNFYWPGYELETREFVKSCLNCQMHSEKKGSAPLIPIRAKGPLDIIEMDIIGPLTSTKHGNRYALCIVDVFTKIAQAIPMEDMSALTTARALLNNFVYIYGSPNRIHSDNGRNFTSQLLKDVLNILNTRQSFTTPYHPQGNGSVERFNKTIKLMITKTGHEDDWDEFLPLLVYKYNCNVHSTTNLSPYQTIFGRHPKLFSAPNNLITPSPYSYIQNLRNTLNKLKLSTNLKSRISQEKYKFNADGRVLLQEVKPGAKVLYKLPLDKKWKGPYTVIKKNGPVNYTIKDSLRTFTVHRNNIKIFVAPDGGKECNGSIP